jgi:hypothetical protein
MPLSVSAAISTGEEMSISRGQERRKNDFTAYMKVLYCDETRKLVDHWTNYVEELDDHMG